MTRVLGLLLTLLWVALDGVAQSLLPAVREMECGQMVFRQPTLITVNLRNVENSPVRITKVDTGCGCTTAEYAVGEIRPGESTKVILTFDNKILGHFDRVVRIFDSSSDSPIEVEVYGHVVAQPEVYTGEYPHRLGDLLCDVQQIEFDDVNKGQRFAQEIHIMNPTNNSVTPVALRLPSYLSQAMQPQTLGGGQKGIMTITLNSRDIKDYGLTQSTIYIGKNAADKVSSDICIPVSVVLLPPAVAQDDESRQTAPHLVVSSYEVEMPDLHTKAKSKGEVVLTNDGKSVLEIQKVQLFTTGIEVELGQQQLAPGQSTRMKVTARAKEIDKSRTKPRILLITNDPDNQKVVINIKER